MKGKNPRDEIRVQYHTQKEMHLLEKSVPIASLEDSERRSCFVLKKT